MNTRYQLIEQKMIELKKVRKDTEQYNEEFWDMMNLSWIYHDFALEGTVLSHHEIIDALNPSGIVDASMVATYQEIRNFRNTIDLVRKKAISKRNQMTLETFKQIHTLLVKGFNNIQPGRYRKDTPLHRTYYHELATPNRISYLMRKLINYIKSPEFKQEHPIKQASKIHYKVIHIFPFANVSGKIARLIMNIILLQWDYMPSIIHAIERQDYYEALKEPHAGIRNLIINSMENSIENAIRFYHEHP